MHVCNSSHYLTTRWSPHWSHNTFAWIVFDQAILWRSACLCIDAGNARSHIIPCYTWNTRIMHQLPLVPLVLLNLSWRILPLDFLPNLCSWCVVFWSMLLMVLDSASSASYVSERLSQSLYLPHFWQGVQISGIAGLSPDSPLQAIASLTISAVQSPLKKFKVTGIVVPRAMCDLPLHPSFLFDVEAAFQSIFVEGLCQGWRTGALGSLSLFQTEFGWVLTSVILWDINSHNCHRLVMTLK